jgi:hypothetical protein
MVFTRIKVIKGIKYAYLIKAYRDKNGKPKQKVKYLGRADKIKRGLK